MSSELSNQAYSEISIKNQVRTKVAAQSDYIASNSIRKTKQIYTLSLAFVSFAGFVIALYQLLVTGVGALEIGLLTLMSTISGIGITVGFHRLFSHKTFDARPVIKIILAIFGSMAGEGSIIAWVSVHRCHHQYTDVVGDPHSPHLNGEDFLGKVRGFWHAHIGWLMDDRLPNSLVFAKDLMRDPIISKINRLYLVWISIGILIPCILGGIFTISWSGAFQGFIWGGLARLFLSFNGGYAINSLAHFFGTRMFNTTDRSTNNIWLAIPTFGEGWHNNHHSFPNSAQFGLKWWQVDIGYYFIYILKSLGLVWDIKVPSVSTIEAKKLSKQNF